MDIIEDLIAGHREVRERKDMLKKLAANINNDAFFWDNTHKIMNFFDNELVRHFELEERVLFPVLKNALPDDKKCVVDETIREHGPINQKLAGLKTLIRDLGIKADKGSRERITTVSGDLLESLILHAYKEDSDIFPLVKQHFTREHFIMMEELYFKFIGVSK